MENELKLRTFPSPPPDLDLRERIRDRILLEPRPLRPDFPPLLQVFRDRLFPDNYYEATFGPVSISFSSTSKRGGVTAMACTGGAIIIEGGVMGGVSLLQAPFPEEVPASFLCSQSAGVITYTPHT